MVLTFQKVKKKNKNNKLNFIDWYRATQTLKLWMCNSKQTKHFRQVSAKEKPTDLFLNGGFEESSESSIEAKGMWVQL